MGKKGTPPKVVWNDSVFDPGDLTQGLVGNCWVIASIAALAEFPGAIKQLFGKAEPEIGRYVVQLYDMNVAQWRPIEIDDYIPCVEEHDWDGVPYRVLDGGTPCYNYHDTHNDDGSLKLAKKWVPHFGRPAGNKVWAILLEKAMAKFVGCYGLLAGGSEPYALMALTGFPIVYCLVRPAVDAAETSAILGEWRWRGAEYAGRDMTGPGYVEIPGIQEQISDDEAWRLVRKFRKRSCLMTACITRFRRPDSIPGYFRKDGLVFGHAYSVLSVVSTEGHMDACGSGIRLVRLRNPHGSSNASHGCVCQTEWNGDWCTKSPLWHERPDVAAHVKDLAGIDGIFWMSWDDFCRTFDKVCVLPKCMDAEYIASRRPFHGGQAPGAGGLGLARMADAETREELRRLRHVFDPFLLMPAFLDDGTMETRLRWEACKPGRLQGYLDLNRSTGNEAGYNYILRLIGELGLSEALKPQGHMAGVPCSLTHEPDPRPPNPQQP
eukprot:NODE_4360_length_1901_cov_9.913754.p1 GENE.NODE_4360_length_1901_cov_9.913754~~NODE_4360_length_1901_cov_9.913754.p1  ORF type:complete len:492 (+),score=87.09 NODE_4360_length_1901_cov_9.913754:140-1615(+)